MTEPPPVVRVTPRRFAEADTLDAFIAQATRNQDFWRAVHRTARIPAGLQTRAGEVGGSWHLLALVEDWCGDAVNTVPVIARLATYVPQCSLRVLRRDINPDLMDAHLTRGTRSIPVVMVLDHAFEERGWWGPRPGPLQEWYYTRGRTLERPERSLRMREWYARDRGVTTAAEVLAILEAGQDLVVRGDSSGGAPGS